MPGHLSDWPRLFKIACSLIDQVNSEQPVIEGWTFGGGTAMMLQIGHRESRDVDIFLDDAQYLGLLNPDRNDFRFEVEPTACAGDGSSFQKFTFEGIGEIDFIIGHAMTASPTVEQTVEGRTVLLEAISEIITKKIYYRGATITPRDIFDIAAGAQSHEAEIVAALKHYEAEAKVALATIERLNPEYVAGTIAALAIKEEFTALASTALERAKAILASV
jgi:hypothetical protein